MSEFLADGSQPALASAVQENMEGFFEIFARNVPNCEIEESAELARFATGIPFHLANGVIRTRLTSGRLVPAICDTIAFFTTRRLPAIWIIGPMSEPAGLGAALAAEGAPNAASMPGMAVDLTTLPTEAPPSSVSVRAVSSPEEMAAWTEVFRAGNEISADVARRMAAPLLAMKAHPELPVVAYVALVDGQPASASVLFLGAGVAGIYCVATIPAFRNRGLGRAVTLAPLLEARSRGYRFGTLQASAMGKPVYTKLGFFTCCDIHVHGVNLTAGH